MGTIVGVAWPACLALVVALAIWRAAVRLRGNAPQADTHTLVDPELGTTMADGGQPTDDVLRGRDCLSPDEQREYEVGE
ncbi:MAG: hypothetical protein KAY32_18045 [Candidatus Eisenbacteria sp.]|nr:hypothetical protein [Candidatus Eisenbacteria bacterium]